jgi:putative transposase
VSEHQAAYPIATMRRLRGVSSSGYHAWVKRRPSQRSETDAALIAEIRVADEASRGTYGAPRVHAELAAKDIRVGRTRVARLMTQAGLAGDSRRKFVTTTVKDGGRQAPDLIERNVTTERPDLLWVADTYIPTRSGFLYLAVVLDAYSRRIVGWSMATTDREGDLLAWIGQHGGKGFTKHCSFGTRNFAIGTVNSKWSMSVAGTICLDPC